jgi:transposase
MPVNIFNLSSYVVTTLVENEHDFHIDAEAKEHPSTCQVCGTADVVGFGRNEQLVRDLQIHVKRVGIYVDSRRYRCRACNKTFYERLPSVDAKRMMTIHQSSNADTHIFPVRITTWGLQPGSGFLQ